MGHAGSSAGFYANDAKAGAQCSGGRTDTGDQPATADWAENDGCLGGLREDFESHRALASNDTLVIVGVHQGQATLLRQGVHFLPSLIDVAMQDDVSSQGSATLHLEAAGILRHYNGHRYVGLPGGPGKTKRVVARRYRTQAAGQFLMAGRSHPVQGTSGFERPGSLTQFGLEPNRPAQSLR